MPSNLKRDLGLPETFAVAVGAMIGSGIFILPGIAWVYAGSAAVAAFVIAAILVLPAALAVAEMSTAIPEDGGPYLYVERSMGPLLGTIAGVGTWLMLSLKSALALVGGVPYLVYVSPGLERYVLPLAVALALFFTVLNLVSAEGSGKLQFGIVGILVLILAFLVVGGIPDIELAATAGAFDPTTDGILAATAIVFISYAGLTKIGAVAEEVENPGRNLPLAIVGALAFVAIVYALVVYLTVGVLDVQAAIDAGDLSSDGEGPIIALVADQAIGTVGALAIVLAALLALASTANAGLLAASRFPLAMARDGIFPDRLESVSERFSTPVPAVALSGIVLVAMVFLPIQQVAAFGSAFQILVFILLNVALVGFREGVIQEYDPAFETPLYPWTPIFGIVGGVVVLSYMGPVAIAGALGIGLLAALWYLGYVRYHQGGVDRESAARVGVRDSIDTSAVERTQTLFESAREYDVLVALTERTSEGARRDMLRIASDLGRLRTTAVSVVEFVDVPDHILPERRPIVQDDRLPDWLETDPESAPDWFPAEKVDGVGERGGDDGVPDGGVNAESHVGTAEAEDSTDATDPVIDAHIRYQEIDSGDHKRAIVDFATYEQIDLLLVERDVDSSLPGRSETEWLLQNAPCDVAIVEDRGFEGIEEIAVANRGRGPYDPLKLLIADAIAEETGAEINLIQAIPEDAPETRRESAEAYHADLISMLTVPARSTVLETDDQIEGVARFVGDADLLVTGVSHTGPLDRIRGERANKLVDSVECTAIMVQTHDARQQSLLEQLLMEYLF